MCTPSSSRSAATWASPATEPAAGRARTFPVRARPAPVNRTETRKERP